MGLFRPYERTDSPAEPPESATPDEDSTPGAKKKATPTPTRKEAEAARMERLHPTLSPKEQRRRDREAQDQRRGEQMRRADAQPGRVLMRDVIDSRAGFSQWSTPVMMITLAAALVLMYVAPQLALAATLVPYVVILAIIVDLTFMWRGFKKLHSERLPNESTKGLLMYGVSRNLSFRRQRVPAPRVKPGDKI